MRRITFMTLLVACFSISATAEEPTVETLIALAPMITSKDPSCKSIELAGELAPGAGILKFQASYQSPDQFAFVLKDASDDTPIVFAAGRQALFYDPIRPALLYLPDVSIRFSMGIADEDHFLFHYRFYPNDESEVVFDINSVVTMTRSAGEVTSLPEGYRLTLTTLRGNKTLAVVDPAASALFSKVELFPKESEVPLLSVSTISTNHAVPGNRFKFPDVELLAKSVSVHRAPIDETAPDFQEFKDLFDEALNTLSIRLAIRRPELRAKMPEVDWERVEAHEKAFSKLLREALSFETL